MDSLWTGLSLLLTAVSIHPNKATFTYTGTLSLTRGYNQFFWRDLPPTFDPASIRAALPPTSKAYIVESRTEPYTPTWTEDPPDLKLLRRQIDSIAKFIYTQESRLALLKAQETTLLENQKLGGEEGGTSAPAVEAYLRLLARELPAIREAMYPLNLSIEAAKDSLNRWKAACQSRKTYLTQRRSALYLRLYSPNSEVIPLRVELQVPRASWRTQYLVRLPNPITGPLYVQRWTQIENQTGIDWKGVRLTLTTASPTQEAAMSPFEPWYIDLYEGFPAHPSKAARYRPEAASADGSTDFADNDEEGPGAAPPPAPVEQTTTLARTYTLGTHTIPTGQSAVQLLLKEDTFAVRTFFIVNAPSGPKAYLRAALPLQTLQLSEPGEARLEVEGQPVGRLSWPPTAEEDTVWLDLGPTERLLVSREEIQRRRESSLAGGATRHVFAYRLSVASTYTQPVQVTIWDRIPISRNSEVKVELSDSGKGTLDAETGRLTWNIQLEPGQRWETTFRFTIRSPKGKTLIGL
jgi:uncharacterized protein (TIGR02231 family)